MDKEAVWSRVLSPAPEGAWEERLLWESEALAEDLGRLPQARQAQQQISGLLRGIRLLEGGKPLSRPPRSRREEYPAGLYRRSLRLAREYAARAAAPDTGHLWQTAAQDQLEQCTRIARSLGGNRGPTDKI